MERRTKVVFLMLMTMIMAASLSGCGLLGRVRTEFDTDYKVKLKDAEMKSLYIQAVNEIAKEMVQVVPFSKNNRVWVTALSGGMNTDEPEVAMTVDAFTHALLANNKCSPVERDSDMVRDMFVEYTESNFIPPRSDALAKSGRLSNADFILAYRITKLEFSSFNYIERIGQRISVVLSFGELQANQWGAIAVGMHIRAIDVKTGEDVWTGYIDKTVTNDLFNNRVKRNESRTKASSSATSNP